MNYEQRMTRSKQIIGAIFLAFISIACQKNTTLENDLVKIAWKKQSDGWVVSSLEVHKGAAWKSVGVPSGKYTLLYS